MSEVGPDDDGPLDLSLDRITDEEFMNDFEFLMQKTRVKLLQQILASESGALSIKELSYRNPDLSDGGIRYHITKLVNKNIIRKLELEEDQRKDNLPYTFYAVSRKGILMLERTNLKDEIKIWASLYARIERDDEINYIESMRHRPTPDWYEQIFAIPEVLASDYAALIEEKDYQNNVNILVVEDEVDVADLYSGWISNENRHVETACNGEEALEKVSERDFDIITLDRKMPGMSGVEFLMELRDRGVDSLVVLLTAVEPGVEVFEYPFEDYIVKPVGKDSLNKTIGQLESILTDEQLRELFALNSKISMLAQHMNAEELENNEEYANLMSKFESLRAQIKKKNS